MFVCRTAQSYAYLYEHVHIYVLLKGSTRWDCIYDGLGNLMKVLYLYTA